MKNLVLFLTSLLLSTGLSAQEQTGLVREQNSNKRAIAGVQVIFSDAVPTTSDDNGIFKLSFLGRKEGDIVFFESIRKMGFELVNGKELRNIQISNNGVLSVDIILAKEGVIDAAKKEYYDVSDQALTQGFNRKKGELRQQIQKERISQEEYIDQLERLQEQYDRQQRSLNALSEKFARVNFDDVSDIYREALELFKAGLVDEAIAKLEEAGFLGRSDKHLVDRKRIEDAFNQLERQKRENNVGIQEDIAAMLQLVNQYVENGNMEEAETYYDMLLQLDNTNLNVLHASGDFYQENEFMEKALSTFNKIKAHPQASEEEILDAKQMIINLSSQEP